MAALLGSRFFSGYYAANTLILLSYILLRIYSDKVDPSQRKGQIKDPETMLQWVSAAAAAGPGARAPAALSGWAQRPSPDVACAGAAMIGARARLHEWHVALQLESGAVAQQCMHPICGHHAPTPARRPQEKQAGLALAAILAFKFWRRRSWDHAAGDGFFYSKVVLAMVALMVDARLLAWYCLAYWGERRRRARLHE